MLFARDKDGQKGQVMNIAPLSTGTVNITDQAFIEMESGSSITATTNTGASYTIVATELRRYGIPKDVVSIAVSGDVRIV